MADVFVCHLIAFHLLWYTLISLISIYMFEIAWSL